VVRGCSSELQSRHKWCYYGDGRVMNEADDAAKLRSGCYRLTNSNGATTVAAFFDIGATGWLRFQRATTMVGRGGGCRGGWRLRYGDGRREGKLGLGFWMCEGERVMRCHSMIRYFSE